MFYCVLAVQVLPIGRRQWKMGNSLKNYTKPNEIPMLLSTCTPGKEYTCSSGACIEIYKRCDGNIDCTDASDEENCKKIISKFSILLSKLCSITKETLIIRQCFLVIHYMEGGRTGTCTLPHFFGVQVPKILGAQVALFSNWVSIAQVAKWGQNWLQWCTSC